MASFDCSSESFHPLNPPVSSSFTSADDDDDKPYPSSLFSGGAPHTIGSGLPGFKSAQSPPLPISPSSFFSISEYLDSPLLLSSSHKSVSPTTGASPVQAFVRANNYPDFSFRPNPTNPSPSAMQEACSLGELQELQAGISPEIVTNSTQNNKNFSFRSGAGDCPKPTQSYRMSSKVVDGYNWRKYGQKQVKKSENPRSYYKCTHPSCLTKKIVETSLDGQTTEIIYKGNHNHPKPEFTRRSSPAPSSGSGVVASNASHFFNPSCNIKTHYQSSAAQGFSRMESVATSENSSVSFDYGDVDHKNGNQEKSISGTDEIDEGEPDTKRWTREGGDEVISSGGSRGGKEERVVVQTMSDIDVLPDGYKWRKYGQKVVKGNPNPRSYYKCTERGCGVRKHVERAAHDVRAVMTTYEGRHNHCVPSPVKPYKP